MVYHSFTGVGIWASLGKQGLQKLHTTLGEIARLHNCAVADKGSIDKYYRDLGKSGKSWDYKNRTTAQLCSCRHNAKLWHDVTPQQRLKCKEMDGGTNVMITYDATKMDGAYSDGIINNTPLFH